MLIEKASSSLQYMGTVYSGFDPESEHGILPNVEQLGEKVIDLLNAMQATDPTTRPSAAECLVILNHVEHQAQVDVVAPYQPVPNEAGPPPSSRSFAF